MIEEDLRFHGALSQYKIVTHDEYDVNVIGFRFGRDVTTEKNNSIQFSCRLRELMHLKESRGHASALLRAAAKTGHDFLKRRLVNAFGQIAAVRKFWKCHANGWPYWSRPHTSSL